MIFDNYLQIIANHGSDSQQITAFKIVSDKTILDETKYEKLGEITSQINYNNKFKKFIVSENNNNSLIYASTQVSKLNATIEFILKCFEMKVPVIFFTDNKHNQYQELFKILQIELTDIECRIMKVSERKFKKKLNYHILNNCHRIVILCTNEPDQIEKLSTVLTYALLTNTQYDTLNFVIIYDESEQIAKNKKTKVINKVETKAYKQLLILITIFESIICRFNLKKLFTTTNPENTIIKYNIESSDVIFSEISKNYMLTNILI